MVEDWRPVPGFDSFIRATSDGRVGILCIAARGPEVKVRKPHLNSHGYHVMTLPGVHPKRRHFLMHRLVMLAFAGDCPEGMEINHKNGIKTDNRLDNLEYCTRQENIDHARIVLGPYNRTKKSRLTEDKVRLIRARYAAGDTSMDRLAHQFGVVAQTIHNIVRHKTWKHIE